MASEEKLHQLVDELEDGRIAVVALEMRDASRVLMTTGDLVLGTLDIYATLGGSVDDAFIDSLIGQLVDPVPLDV